MTDTDPLHIPLSFPKHIDEGTHVTITPAIAAQILALTDLPGRVEALETALRIQIDMVDSEARQKLGQRVAALERETQEDAQSDDALEARIAALEKRVALLSGTAHVHSGYSSVLTTTNLPHATIAGAVGDIPVQRQSAPVDEQPAGDDAAIALIQRIINAGDCIRDECGEARDVVAAIRRGDVPGIFSYNYAKPVKDEPAGEAYWREKCREHQSFHTARDAELADLRAKLAEAKATAEADADALAGLLARSRVMVEEITLRMPRHMIREHGPQDPLGAHALLAEIDAALVKHVGGK